jgi:hypothetical protein
VSGYGNFDHGQWDGERAANTDKADAMPVAVQDPYSGEARREAGFLITIREQQTDERRILHQDVLEALNRIAERIDALEGDWRVLSLCTPTSIYRDLQGTRKRPWGDAVQFPELSAFGRIHRLDLLDPFFDPYVPRGQSHA